MSRPLTRERLPDIAFLLACVVSLGVLTWLGSGLTFVRDEWSIIRFMDRWSFDAIVQPHNQHFDPLFRIVWNSLMETVGLRSYVPYLLIDHVLVVLTAAGIYVYARRQTHALIALAVGVLYLFLGSGFANLFMAFQMGWTGAAAAGMWGLVLLLREPRPRHAWAAAILFLISVTATGSFALPFLAAAGSLIVISPQRRRLWWVVVPALVIFGTWYILLGRESGLTFPSPAALARFVENGIANTVGQVSGLGRGIGLVIAILIGMAALSDAISRPRPRLGLIAGAVGLATLWLLVGIARAGIFPEGFSAPRYVHIAAVFVLVAVVGWLGQRRFRRPPELVRLAAIVGLVALMALGWNVYRLYTFHGFWASESDSYRAAVTLLLAHGGSPALPDDRGLVRGPDGALLLAEPGRGALVPGPSNLRELVERFGSPVDDPLAIRGTRVSDSVLDLVFERLVADSFLVGTEDRPPDLRPPDIAAVADVEVTGDGTCIDARTTGPSPRIDLMVPSGASVYIAPETDGMGSVILSLTGSFSAPERPIDLDPARPTTIGVPDIGRGESLQIRLLVPVSSRMSLCMASAPPPEILPAVVAETLGITPATRSATR